MTASKDKDQLILGFYAVREDSSGGFSGGILLTNHLGRPLEFQCTLPVVPNATQRLLYGKTLKDFLIGDLILEALYRRLKIKSDWLFCSSWFPEASSKLNDVSILTTQCDPNRSSLSIHQNEFDIIQFDQQIDQNLLTKIEQMVPESADLSEPLIRVESALNEVLQSGKVA